jgi:hypothetical protein
MGEGAPGTPGDEPPRETRRVSGGRPLDAHGARARPKLSPPPTSSAWRTVARERLRVGRATHSVQGRASIPAVGRPRGVLLPSSRGRSLSMRGPDGVMRTTRTKSDRGKERRRWNLPNDRERCRGHQPIRLVRHSGRWASVCPARHLRFRAEGTRLGPSFTIEVRFCDRSTFSSRFSPQSARAAQRTHHRSVAPMAGPPRHRFLPMSRQRRPRPAPRRVRALEASRSTRARRRRR